MATLAQIVLIMVCACLVDCRFLQKLHKHQPDDHQTAKINVKDPDAVVFPSANDSHLADDGKIKQDMNVVNKTNMHGNDKAIDDKVNVADIIMPLISKNITEVDVKDVFTNLVLRKEVKDKVEEKRPKELVGRLDSDVKNDKTANEKQNIKDNKVSVLNKNDTLEKYNENVPDLSSRFGGAGNYMLVPVAANVPNYQPIQSNPNLIAIGNVQGNIPTQTYVTPTELNADNQQFTLSNVGPNVQYATANGITNVGATLQAANIVSNVGPEQYPVNNVNYAQGTNTYVPITVPNTYVINGQLYAAVTVPNNGNVPNALYYVNPQVGYQVANNIPLYKLVPVNGENQLQNTQYVYKN